jgi:hypothetical protein
VSVTILTARGSSRGETGSEQVAQVALLEPNTTTVPRVLYGARRHPHRRQPSCQEDQVANPALIVLLIMSWQGEQERAFVLQGRIQSLEASLGLTQGVPRS